jgi:hypothetical protein
MSAVRLILATLFSSTLGSKLIIGVDTYLGFTKVGVLCTEDRNYAKSALKFTKKKVDV